MHASSLTVSSDANKYERASVYVQDAMRGRTTMAQDKESFFYHRVYINVVYVTFYRGMTLALLALAFWEGPSRDAPHDLATSPYRGIFYGAEAMFFALFVFDSYLQYRDFGHARFMRKTCVHIHAPVSRAWRVEASTGWQYAALCSALALVATRHAPAPTSDASCWCCVAGGAWITQVDPYQVRVSGHFRAGPGAIGSPAHGLRALCACPVACVLHRAQREHPKDRWLAAARDPQDCQCCRAGAGAHHPIRRLRLRLLRRCLR